MFLVAISLIIENFISFALFVLGYHWLPLTTIDLVDDNRQFSFRHIVRYYTHYGWLTFLKQWMSIIGYYWLNLATIDLVGDNRNLKFDGIF